MCPRCPPAMAQGKGRQAGAAPRGAVAFSRGGVCCRGAGGHPGTRCSRRPAPGWGWGRPARGVPPTTGLRGVGCGVCVWGVWGAVGERGSRAVGLPRR